MSELTVRLRLLADVRDFSRNLQRASQQGRASLGNLNQQVGSVGTGLKKAEKASTGFFQNLKNNVGTQIKAGIMFASLYQALITFRQTIGAAGEELFLLDDALRKVQSISKDSDAVIKQLDADLLRAARTGALFGQTAGEIATGMFEIVQAGFETGEAFDIAQVAAQAATTGFTEAAIAGKVITGAMLAFNMEADKARYVANILFQTVDTGVVKFEELATGLGVAMAPAAALGVPLEELGAAVATMTVKGMPASRALTSLTRILMQFLDPSEQAAKAAESVGFSLSAQTIETYGLMGAMKLLNEATGGDVELLADMFDRQRALVGGFTLLNDNATTYERTLRLMNGAQEDGGALERAWIERQKSLIVRLGLMKAAILGVVVPALQPFTASLAFAADAVSSFIADESGLFVWLNRMAKITGLTAAWQEFRIAIIGLKSEGGDGRLSLMFGGLFVVLREGIPRIMELLVLLLRVGIWAVENKPILIALALAFGAMFVAAHPLLAVFQALSLIVGYASENWGDWRVRVVSVTAAVLLAVTALNMLWSSFTATQLAMSLFNTNLKGVTGSTNLLTRAMMNAAAGIKDAAQQMAQPFIDMAKGAGRAAIKAWSLANALANILAKPVKIARTVTVTTIQKTQKAAVGAGEIRKNLIGGIIEGLPKGIGQGIGAAIMTGIGIAFVAVAGFLAPAGAGALVVAGIAGLLVVLVLAVVVAAFLIYKYRKEIWAGLKTLGGVLKEFFTEKLPEMMQPLIDGFMNFFTVTLPAWAKQQFTAENMGRWFGRILMAAILLVLWPAVLVYMFRDKLGEWLTGITEFLAEIPGKIAELIGDAAGVIIGWIVDAAKWVIEFEKKVIEFELKIVEFIAGLPGRIAAFIGDNWKDVLDWLVDAAKWAAEFYLKVAEFYFKVADFVAGIPGTIAEFIGEHWSDIVNFLINPSDWWDLFKDLLQEFIDLVTEKIGPMLAGIGGAVVSGIKTGFTTAFEGLGGWIIDKAKAALGPIAGWLSKGVGIFSEFFGAVPSGMQDVIDWLEAAEGVTNFAGGLALVGERGAEFVRLPRGADVVRNADMGQALRETQTQAQPQRAEDFKPGRDRQIVLYVDRLTIEGDPREAIEALGLQAAAGAGVGI